MWKNVDPVYSAGIQTHNLKHESLPITTRPGLPSNFIRTFQFDWIDSSTKLANLFLVQSKTA